jgi:hypothetical protein
MAGSVERNLGWLPEIIFVSRDQEEISAKNAKAFYSRPLAFLADDYLYPKWYNSIIEYGALTYVCW